MKILFSLLFLSILSYSLGSIKVSSCEDLLNIVKRPSKGSTDDIFIAQDIGNNRVQKRNN